MKILLFASILSCGFRSSMTMSIFAQGSIVPATPPNVPIMKTLGQIEPRTPIPVGSSTYNITGDGSYYLTGNLTVSTSSAIAITANDVTLDLNGFTIAATAGNNGGRGIYYGGNGHLTVRNGHIRGDTTYDSGNNTFSNAGIGDGILIQSGTSVLIENIDVTGVSNSGINVNSSATSAVISHCQTIIAGASGITTEGRSALDHCIAKFCGLNGIQGREVSDCYGSCVSIGSGIVADTVLNCYGESAGGFGIAASTATNCYGVATSNGSGINAVAAQGCRGGSSTGIGLFAADATACQGTSGGNSSGLIATNATSCNGTSVSGAGINCSTASNCRGSSTSGIGLTSTTADSCYGFSSTGSGIVTTSATNCYGQTTGTTASSYGIDCSALGIAIGCRALAPTNTSTPYSLRTFIANSCVVTGGSIAINFKYNMP